MTRLRMWCAGFFRVRLGAGATGVATLAAMLLLSPAAVGQDAAAAGGRFSDRASWVQIDLPQAWTGPRYVLTARSGPEAAARQAGAAYWLSFDYLPDAAELPRHPLLRISVFPRAAWMKLSGDAPSGDLLVQTDTRVYMGELAGANPYPPGGADAKRFDAMRFTPQGLLDAFTIAGDTDGTMVRSTRIAPARPRLQHLAAARLTCSGRDPGWTLAINKGSTARLALADEKPSRKPVGKAEARPRARDTAPKAQVLKGRMEFADQLAVWRGRSGKGGDWVAMVREEACDGAARRTESHAVLLSRPDGTVLQGCCGSAN